jgi:hypothetical protein
MAMQIQVRHHPALLPTVTYEEKGHFARPTTNDTAYTLQQITKPVKSLHAFWYYNMGTAY